MDAEVLVLCYHGVSDTWPMPTTVRPGALEEQVAHFVGEGYRGATLSDALTWPPHPRTLVVTFDDACRSVGELAAPILARYKVPGTVFVPTDYAGTDRPMAWSGHEQWLGTEHEHELLCLGWDALRGLADEGWEVGSHTCSHPRLAGEPDERVLAELTESRRICEERMGGTCRSVAYPYSDYDRRSVEAAAAAGYSFAVTVPTSPEAALPLQWPRVGVYLHDDLKRVRLRVMRRRYRPATWGRVLAGVKARASRADGGR